MKPVTAYQAFDGSVFDTAEKCAEYETHCTAVSKIIDKLPRFPMDEDFQIGKSYYQHDSRVFLPVMDEFFAYMASRYNHPQFTLRAGQGLIPTDTDWFINFFRSVDDKPGLLAWYYIGMVDKKFRQWSQPYFTKNPNETAVMINAPDNIV